MGRKLLAPFIMLSPVMVLPAHADHLSGGFDLGQSSAIMTESAIPLAKGDWYLGLRYEQVDNTGLDDDRLIGLRAFDILANGGAHDDLHSIERVTGTSLSLAYGVSENLTLGLRVPYIKRENIREPEEGHSHGGAPIVIHNVIEHGDSKGLGDATAMGLYRFNAGESYDMSLLFGLRLPTGIGNENGFRDEVFVRRVDTGIVPDEHGDGHSHEGTRLETHQQPGGGSWDPIFGLAYSRVLGAVNLDSSAIYTFANAGDQDTNLGDSLNYNLGLTYPLQENLDVVMELNGEWRDRETRGSEVVGNSGGSHLYLSPGVRYGGTGWSVSLSYGLPLAERLNGDQSEPDHRFVANLNFNF